MKDDQFKIGEVSVNSLVAEFGEPLYVYDAAVLISQYRKLRRALPGAVDIMYSMKANPCAAIVSYLGDHVSGIEVSSIREMYAAEAAGVLPERMIFVGPAKSEEELRFAVVKQIGCIVAESEDELHAIEQIANTESLRINVALRINPFFDSAGARLKMSGAPRQFGVDEEAADRILKGIAGFRAASLVGIHVYVGTRILDYRVVIHNTREVLELAARLQNSLGRVFSLIDFGGGLGVPYSATEDEFDIESFAQEMKPLIAWAEATFPHARFLLESGRYLVADAGVYLTRVRYVKESRGQKFALVSGGMNHHMATTSAGSLVKTHFPIEAVSRVSEPKTERITICGPLCTPSDVLAKAVSLPDLRPGDLLGILRSGAYGATASPLEFLSHGRPAELLVEGGRAHLIRRSSSIESILDNQLIPTFHQHVPDLSEACNGVGPR